MRWKRNYKSNSKYVLWESFPDKHTRIEIVWNKILSKNMLVINYWGKSGHRKESVYGYGLDGIFKAKKLAKELYETET